MSLSHVHSALRKFADPARARALQKYFKTGPGEYGEGDLFLGIRVPETRQVARVFRDLPLKEIQILLRSKFHEERMLALLILTDQYPRADSSLQRRIFKFYLAHRTWINNWDLIDGSAPAIVGGYLIGKDLSILDLLSRSQRLWDRRIAILATFYFIRRRDFKPTLRLAQKLQSDPEDLMHKAVGWMLREIGNRDGAVLEAYLGKHFRDMPRTMLRYSIERLSPAKRRKFMARD